MALEAQVNFLAVFVTAIIGFLIGWLWYGPFFGKVWMKAMNISKKDVEKSKQKGDKSKKEGMGKSMIIAFIMMLVSAYVLAIFVGLTSASTIMNGAFVGFLAWLGFYLATSVNGILWEGKSKNLFYINASHDLVRLIIMGAILAVW